MKLPRFRNPFKLATPVIYTRYEDGKVSVEFDKLPLVVRLTLNYVERAAMKPEALGYRMVRYDDDYLRFSAIYARPFLVWLPCKVAALVRRAYRHYLISGALTWLYYKNFVSYAGPEAEIFRWRYLRPGRRLLHPWRPSHWEKLSRRNWIWWFDEFWFHHKIRLLCQIEVWRHGYTWHDAGVIIHDR